jgi:hypothetical protein
MRIKGVLDISGTHDFEYVPDKDLWFPKRKLFKIVKGKMMTILRSLVAPFNLMVTWTKISNQESVSRRFLSIYYLKPIILISHTTPAVLDKKYITVELKKKP